MTLNPIHVTIAQLLEGRLFRIPSYQRAYSWRRNQRDDLFKDIKEAHRSGRDHFMATVVALARNTLRIGADEFRMVELVDGQQRLTTLVILLKAIEKALLTEDLASAKAKIGLIDLLVKGDEHSLILLQTNHDSSHVFTDYIRRGEIRKELVVTAADASLVEAMEDCENFVAGWGDRGTLVDLLATVRNRMSMILHEITDESVVYRVFEVLNSRGLDVKWVDKLKSQLMASIYEYVPADTRGEGLSEMHTIWQDIYRAIGLRDDHADEALQFAGTFAREQAPNRILPEEDAAREMLRKGGEALKTIIEAGRHLERVNRLVHELHGDVRRRAVVKILHARFVGVAIMLRGFDEATRDDLLARWERTTFRLFGLARLDARSYVGDYVRLGHEIITGALGSKVVAERLEALSKDYDIGEVMQLKTYWDDWYSRAEETRYVLFRYDEQLAKQAGEQINTFEWNKIWTTDSAKSIEHIKPQHTEVSYLHNLGNLTMLPPGVNSSLGGLPPNEKASSYVSCGLKGTVAVGRSIHGGLEWNEVAVQARCEQLERFIRSYWKV